VVQVFFDSYVAGKTEAESRSAGRVALLAVLKKLQPLADDDVLADIGAVYADQYNVLGMRSAAQCYQYASGVGLTAIPDFPSALVARENDVNKRVIETATSRPPVSSASLDPIWKKIGAALTNSGIKNDQFELFTAATVPSERYGDYCAMATTLFKVISRLPRSEAAAVMRSILADN
jgi:hypothetical protein